MTLAKYQKFAILLLILFSLFSFILIPASVSARDTGLEDTVAASGGGLIDPDKRPISVIIGDVIGALLSFIGVLFFILMIYGGLRWMLAQGNDAEIEKAKQIIISAFIGLVIVLSAYAITAFVGQAIVNQ